MLYLLLADGFEEIEAIATLDVIRRAELKILTVGVGKTEITGAHSVKVTADTELGDIDREIADGVILPGGMPGTLNLKNNPDVIEFIKYCRKNGLLLSAICAAPMIFGELGMLQGKKAVCFPGFEDKLKGADVQDSGVVCDGNIITSRGAGTALEFGAAIVDYFRDKAKTNGKELLRQMQMKI